MMRGMASKANSSKSEKKNKNRLGPISSASASDLSDARKLISFKEEAHAHSQDEVEDLPSPRKCRAIFDFNASEDNELSFKTGDVISISRVDPSGWCEGELRGTKGFFPSSYVTLLDNGKKYRVCSFFPSSSTLAFGCSQLLLFRYCLIFPVVQMKIYLLRKES
jgi:hypothetical protein